MAGDSRPLGPTSVPARRVLPSLHLSSSLLFFFYPLLCGGLASGGLPAVEHDYGVSPKFVCTPIPPEADPSCYSPPSVPHGAGAGGGHGNGHNGSSRRGVMSEEAKATILSLRESLVRQKETILDQRETIRELTAKLTLCEGFGGHHSIGHHDNGHRDNNNHHDGNNHHNDHHGHRGPGTHQGPSSSHGSSTYHDNDHHFAAHAGGHRADPGHRKGLSYSKPSSFSADQTAKTLQTLKERLENLQARNSSSSYSSSLRDLLQRKINALEEQLHDHYRGHHDYGHHNDHRGHHDNDNHDNNHGSGRHDDDNHDNNHGSGRHDDDNHDNNHGSGRHDDDNHDNNHGSGRHDDDNHDNNRGSGRHDDDNHDNNRGSGHHDDHHNNNHGNGQHGDHRDDHHDDHLGNGRHGDRHGDRHGTGHHDDHRDSHRSNGHHDDHRSTGDHDDRHDSHHSNGHHDDHRSTGDHDDRHDYHHNSHPSKHRYSHHGNGPYDRHYGWRHGRGHGYLSNHHDNRRDNHPGPGHHDNHQDHTPGHHDDRRDDRRGPGIHDDDRHGPAHHDDHRDDHRGAGDHDAAHQGNKRPAAPHAGPSKLDTVISHLHHRNTEAANHKPTRAFQISFPMRTNYMYGVMKRSVAKELFAMTVCLWLRAGSGGPGGPGGLGTPFSYSVPGQANELVLIEWGSNPMELLINDKAVTLPLTLTDEKWHHVCVTWSTRDGLWQAYQDGLKKGSGDNLSAWHPIKPGGMFLLGQEQDSMGGRFDATQSFVGDISDLQFWSRVLAPSEIYNQASCGAHLVGDVLSWSESDVELHGGVTAHPFVPCH